MSQNPLQRFQAHATGGGGAGQPERGQALWRVGIAVLALATVGGLRAADRASAGALLGALLFFTGAVLLCAWVSLGPALVRGRRALALLLDVTAIAAAIHLWRPEAVPLALAYPWLCVDYGMRYGSRFAWAVAVPGAAASVSVILYGSTWPAYGGIAAAVAACTVLTAWAVTTLLERIEAALPASQTTSTIPTDLLASIGDGLQTPLHGAIGMIDLLAATGLNREQRDVLSSLRAAAQVVLVNVNDLLGSTRNSDSTAPSSDAAAGAQPASELAPKPTRRLRILVAMGDGIETQRFRCLLEDENHSVTLCETGEDALGCLEKEEFHLALLDHDLPVMGGLETAKLFRFLHPERRLRIMLFTPSGSPLLENRDAAVDVCVAKRDSRELVEIVRPFLCAISQPTTQAAESATPVRLSVVPQSDNGTVVDQRTLDDLAELGNDPTFMRDLVHAFIDDAHGLLTDITAAIDACATERMVELAYALKSSARSIGAVGLAEACDALWKPGLPALGERIQNVKAAYEHTCRALVMFLEEHDSASS